MKPTDPVTENQNLLKGEPVKAFLFQDHDAHMAVHNFLLQDPMMQQTIGQNPKAQAIVAAITAHIAEHAGYKMRQQIQNQLGMPLPPEDDKLPPQVEISLSAMMAQAAQQALAQNQAMAAQQQAQQQAQDPVVQMQQQELQIRAQEAQTKAAKVQGDLQIAQQRLALDAQKAEADQELAGLKVGAQIKDSQAKLDAQQEREGVRMGIDIAKAQHQARQKEKPAK